MAYISHLKLVFSINVKLSTDYMLVATSSYRNNTLPSTALLSEVEANLSIVCKKAWIKFSGMKRLTFSSRLKQV